MKIDVFAHVMLPRFFQKMQALDPSLTQKMPFLTHPLLTDIPLRCSQQPKDVKQIISFVNANPEDILDKQEALALVKEANQELLETLKAYPEQFLGGVAMLCLSDVEGSVEIIKDFVCQHSQIVGVQLFSRHLGLSVADERFRAIFEACAKYDIPIWLHPVFDERKPDNNIVFTWEYEQTQAMFEIVSAGYFQAFPHLKIISHHAGAMVPFFSGRIEHILPVKQAEDFKKFYVDTAILGNPKALALTIDYFGIDHVLFGTDAPLGVLPSGATELIIEAISQLDLAQNEQKALFSRNIERLLAGEKA
ncbi:amidohydrolase family protein [Streptococcus sp. zg-JUN1979]|uniref:amidohydrolase family protein n=1 Tax=Streptococcus sp. zg-JUN1979 TaxID=3391450 RepID=UPI0039A72864